MKITWLGQAGLLFDNGKARVMIDPYLSDSVEKVNPMNRRCVPVKKELFDIRPDVMIFTHDHLDHYDPETASRFLSRKDKNITVLCPTSVWQKARTHGGGHNYVEFNRYTEWTEAGLRFRAVMAVHSDPFAIGVIIEELDAGRTYYITGDTLYDSRIFAALPACIDMVFLPINGVGNNMNVVDAARFFHASGAKKVMPYHVGMFDTLSPEDFQEKNRVIANIYEEIEV
ncbi:MAG: MBL fold metallo-hydrolase [Clostridia bacterium]|nr:MBL fold metallo-hydrolase [Clostridia bacterium]